MRASAATLLVVLASGCFVPRDSEPRADRTCTRCHGDSSRPGPNLSKAAPPMDTFGNTQVSFPSIGAHEQHLASSERHGPVACNECHRVPEVTSAPGHNDGITQVIFGPVATRDGGVAPQWDRESRTCSNSGCHYATSGSWTRPRAIDVCGTCHGLPPAAPHPRAGACAACHADVVASDGTIALPSLHVDGVVQVTNASCFACHGTTDGGAPPRALDGGTDRSHPGVGAHTAHLTGGTSGRPVECGTCHVVPQRVVTPTHPNGGSAEVLASVKWDPISQQCTTACHGTRSPAWTTLDAGIGCSSCHAAPPAAPHPSVSRCALCHPAQADGSPPRATHVNGIVDVMQPVACNGCHGTALNDAPPRDLSGSQDPARPGVGAHQSHLVGRGLARKVACDECHPVPATVVAPGHLNGLTEVRFQGVARANQAQPTYSALTCRSAACHDVSNWTIAPGGGTDVAPTWTTVDGSQRRCTSCHGMPPPLPHEQRSDCSSCHRDAAPDGGFSEPDLHVNGRVDFAAP